MEGRYVMAVLVVAIAVLAVLPSLSDDSTAPNDIETGEREYELFETVDPSFEIDAGADEILLQFATPVRSDCIIEYGPTDAYGEVVPCGSEMTASHDVLLTGLEPNATYHYRVILLDQDGRFYRSGDETFRFDPVTVEDPEIANRSVVVNASDESPVNIPETASDDDEDTSWEPESGNESFIRFTFDEEKEADSFGIMLDVANETGYIKFDLYVDSSRYGVFEVISRGEEIHTFELSTSGTVFEIDVLETDGDVGISEFEVYPE